MYGLVPAAGLSRRMGRPKLALPVAGKTVLEHVLAALLGAGVGRTVVVLGPHVAELAPLAERGGASALVLAEETPDMRTTVERGLTWLEERYRPRTEDAWLLVPADHPTLRPEVIESLVRARTESPGRSIFVPTWEGKRGHPTLIGWKHAAAVRAQPAGEGLNAYLRRQAAETVEVPAASAAVLADLDTPEDYERLLAGG
jgi:molybdenum cofactor cytidylyltransferase